VQVPLGILFKHVGSIQTQYNGLATRGIKMKLNDRKVIPSKCPICQVEFRNVYSMSAHKAHCSGANSTAHLDVHRRARKGKHLTRPEEVFVERSQHSTGMAKKMFLSLGHCIYQCSSCGLSEWLGEHLVLELDHINGVNSDHRLENLRLLCPNCHSQTANFRGRNKNTGIKKVEDVDLVLALQECPSVRSALMRVGLAP
jgi:Zn finger protein HypA/HybF involved in hydrogenase expression